MKKIQYETDVYPYFIEEKKALCGSAFVIRFDCGAGVPDFCVTLKGVVIWYEIKLYKGKKKIENVTEKDIEYQTGQQKFKKDVLSAGGTYCLRIYNTQLDYKEINFRRDFEKVHHENS